jgi:hypothetical protein
MGSAAIIVAIASALFPHRIAERVTGGNPRIKSGAVLFAVGLAAGAIISIGISSQDYFAGFGLLGRILAESAGDMGVTLHFRRWYVPLALLSAAVLSMIFMPFLKGGLSNGRPLTTGQLILIIGGINITVGFVLIGWSGDGFPRYLAPALLLLTVSAISSGRAASAPVGD